MFHCLPFFISHKLSPINLYFPFATLFYPIFSFASIVFVSLFLNTYFLNDQYFLSSIFFSFLRHSVLLLVPLPFSSIYPSFSLFIILPFIYIILLITFYGQYKNPSSSWKNFMTLFGIYSQYRLILPLRIILPVLSSDLILRLWGQNLNTYRVYV